MKNLNKKKEVNFNSLSKAEKRVMIAKDVIKQIKVGKLVPTNGVYTSISNVWQIDSNADVKTNYKKIETCKVCALGACLMSATKFGNKLKFDDVESGIDNDNPRIKKLFSSIFRPRQLSMIEATFEGCSSRPYAEEAFNTKSLSDTSEIECRKFYDHYNTSEELLIAIMKNIIKHKGEFIPKDL